MFRNRLKQMQRSVYFKAYPRVSNLKRIPESRLYASNSKHAAKYYDLLCIDKCIDSMNFADVAQVYNSTFRRSAMTKMQCFKVIDV
jgi:hypothetical protein